MTKQPINKATINNAEDLLLKQLDQICERYENTAQNDAIEAVRNPTPENQAKAARSVGIYDAFKYSINGNFREYLRKVVHALRQFPDYENGGESLLPKNL